MTKLAACLITLLPFSALAATETYTIDPIHTFPYFEVNHLGFSTMRGRFDKTTGKLTLDRAAKTASVDIAIDAASINTGDQKRADGQRSRDEHLRSADFFNVAEFPKLTYKSTKVNFNGDAPSTIEGNLTLLGVTKPVTLNVTSFKCGANPMSKKEMCGIDATAQIKRSDFGMKYAIPGAGDDLKLLFEVEAYKD